MTPSASTSPASSPVAASALVHQQIQEHCLSGSWFAMRAVLQQLQSPLETGPELLADLLASVGVRSRHEADRLQRLLSHRYWRASGVTVAGARQALTVQCGNESWTLRLWTRPQLHVEMIVRNAPTSGG